MTTTIGDDRLSSTRKDLSNQKRDDDKMIPSKTAADYDSSSSTSSSFLFDYDKPTTTTNKSRRLHDDNTKKNVVESSVQTDGMIDVKTTLPSHKEFLKSLRESPTAGTHFV